VGRALGVPAALARGSRARDGEHNARGVSLLLSLAEFFRAQNHWAFDIFLVVGDGYLHGLEDFMTAYNPRANIWTGLNIDYPYHSFSHLGVFYGESESGI
jgi:glycosylphosphatidylinositol transamidase